MPVRSIAERVEERIRHWHVLVQHTLETESSFLAFGKRGTQHVVLKVLRKAGDEWRCGEVLKAFDGRGTVRVFEYIEGAALLERLTPATSLADVSLSGRDDEAAQILADVIDRMSPTRESTNAFPTVQDWGDGFQSYLACGDRQIARELVESAQQIYSELCASQRHVRVLHGDLQHYNVLHDSDRGWLAIDPKGVVGEIEYEIGASLRNPWERPELFASLDTIERRLNLFGSKLKLNLDRVLAWAFAQAVLSAIWSVEDGFAVDGRHPSIMLANAIHSLVKSRS